jgi:hypothetical protein
MKLLIPIKVQELVIFTIQKEIDFINLNEKQKSNLNKQLLSLWYYIYNAQKSDDNVINLNGFVNIHSKYLQKFYIRLNKKLFGYKPLLNLLKDVNLIDINGKFSKGKFSESYRIKSDIFNNQFEEIELDFDKIFNNIKNKSYWIKKYPTHSKIIKDTYEVKVDLNDYILWLTNNNGLELKPVIKNGVLQKRFLTQERIYDYINDVLKVNYDNMWFKVSDEGRFYNSTTNLSYTSLPFIKLKRRKLKEIDIANCQPLILSKLINSDEYKNDCELGIFYDNLANELGMKRTEIKVLSYKLIFFSNKKLNTGKTYNAMEKLYPGVIEQINELRDKIEISKEMQKIESDIFVNKIGSLDFKMMLRHDAVLVYEEDYDIIKNYVIIEFNKIGLNPTIK